MTLPTAPNTIQVNLQMILGDDINVENRFHIQLVSDGPYTAAQLNGWAEEVHKDWAGAVMPGLSQDLILTQTRSRDLSVLNGGDGLYVPSDPTLGGITEDSLPANVACVGSWKEFKSYRGGHPRTYVAGIPVTVQNDPQHVTSTFAGDLQTGLTGFMTNVNDQGSGDGTPAGVLSVIHYRLNDVAQDPALVELILGVSVSPQIRSQRRRLASG